MKHPGKPIYIYLCGPITGMNAESAGRWRKEVAKELYPLKTIDPTRQAPDFVIRSAEKATEADLVRRRAHGKSTTTRDRLDVGRADLILANLTGAKAVSIGSVGELFWADMQRKPIIIVREAHGNPHDHDMINEIAGWIVPDVGEALNLIKSLFPDSFES